MVLAVTLPVVKTLVTTLPFASTTGTGGIPTVYPVNELNASAAIYGILK
jgi:hypothetical protein